MFPRQVFIRLIFLFYCPALVRGLDEFFLLSVYTDLGRYTIDYTMNVTKNLLVHNDKNEEIFRIAVSDEALEVIKTVAEELQQKCPTLAGSEVLAIGPKAHFASFYERSTLADLIPQFRDAIDADDLVPIFKMRTPQNEYYQVYAEPVNHRRTEMTRIIVHGPNGEEFSDIVYKPMDSLEMVYDAIKELIPHNDNVELVIDNFEPKSSIVPSRKSMTNIDK